MLLPCAKTNLAEFLRNEPHPELTNENVHWLLSQLQGLAEGMRRIHNLNPGFGPAALTANNQPDRKPRRLGFHHDIKPQNILLFANDNVKDRDPPMTQLHCKISDFGAARIHEVLSQPKAKESPQHSSLVRGDPVYGAPDRAIKNKTSRPYDVWSLGCVFLEILLWTFGLEGCDLTEFEEERAKDYGSRTGRFWRETGEGKIKLKESVLRRLRQLEDHCKGRGVFERLVRLTRKMLSVESAERPEAPQICNDLETFLIQSKHDFQKHDFYRHDISAHVEIAAPPSSDGGSRSPSIDERPIYAFGKGSLLVDTVDRSRLWSGDESDDVEQDPYRLSLDANQRDLSRPRHAQRPSSIDIYGPGAQSPSSQIFIEGDVGGEIPHPPLGSHQISIEREDLMHPARPRAISDGTGKSYSHR
jgi:serine/threonine protein kinase